MKKYIALLSIVLCTIIVALLQHAQIANAQSGKKPCYSKQTRATVENTARVYMPPDPDFDPVLGYSRSKGPRPGSPPVDENGFAQPIKCVAAEHEKSGGTLPKFYCTVEGNTDDKGKPVVYKVKPNFKGLARDRRNGEIQGEFLSSRFSKALGFFADDEWVADVTCPDCDKSLTKPFQGGAKWEPFEPASGIEMQIGEGIKADCKDDTEYGDLATSLGKLDAGRRSDETSAEIDAFKLWLAFIDHGDTKKQNQKFSCLGHHDNPDGTRACDQAIYYVSDMGSTFGFSSASEKKARLDMWRGKDPIRVESGGVCRANAKDVGDTRISEAGRKLLADGLQHLLDAEASDQTITRVFAASRNAERDAAPAAWTAEFIRKAKEIIDARCR